MAQWALFCCVVASSNQTAPAGSSSGSSMTVSDITRIWSIGTKAASTLPKPVVLVMRSGQRPGRGDGVNVGILAAQASRSCWA